MSEKRIKLRIIHETNPQKYFPALFELDSDGCVELVGTHRYSVIKEWFRAWLKDRTPFKVRTINAINDFLLRFKLPFIKNEVIVIGFAPWDWRLLIYRQLVRNNNILYQTSWHDWKLENTPRQPKPQWFKKYMQSQWHKFVNHPNVSVIAVTSVVAKTVKTETGAEPTVIPHAVPEVFFESKRKRPADKEPGKLRLLYVGELSEKKGIKVLLDIFSELKGEDVSLTMVGNGPLAKLVKEHNTGVEYLGPIYDREKLAKVMSEHDVLMLLSQKTQTWEELFGIVIVEAIASGCAVIATNHIGPVGILGNKCGNGLFSEQDVSGIIQEVKNCKNKHLYLTELKARQDIADIYSTTTIRRKWHEAIVNK